MVNSGLATSLRGCKCGNAGVALRRSHRARRGGIDVGLPAIDDPAVRDELADFQAQVANVQHIARSAVASVADGTDQPSDGLIAKLSYAELNVAMCN